MKYVSTIGLACLLAVSGPALANKHAMEHGSMQQPTTQTHTGTGTVNQVDMRNGTVNLSHGPIQSLGWPGMTMNFKVQDKAMLTGLNIGQEVVFEIARADSGKFSVVRIEPSR